MDRSKQSQCLIIAGEKSGEEHCMSFLPDIKLQCPDLHFWGVGGDELKNEGMELLYHLKDFSSWGFSEVFAKIPFYLKALKKIEQEVVSRNCKVAILIDFQDFNLRLAKRLKKRGVKILYYVAPQAWVWKAKRATVLQETVHTLFTIIPFEKKWFQDRGVKNVYSVPHPVWSEFYKNLPPLKKSSPLKNRTINILVLPGSRNFEVSHLLPVFMKTVVELRKEFDVEVSLVQSTSVQPHLYEKYSDQIDYLYSNEHLDLALSKADLAIAASGTVTLSCALFQVPTVVGYKGSLFNEYIYNTFISYDGYFVLPNIVFEEEVFPELIQDDAYSLKFIDKLRLWIDNFENYKQLVEKLGETRKLLKGDKAPGEYIAKEITKSLKEAM